MTAFAVLEPVRGNVTVDGNATEQVSTFKYLACEIPYMLKINLIGSTYVR
jgi:hypothetical protein